MMARNQSENAALPGEERVRMTEVNYPAEQQIENQVQPSSQHATSDGHRLPTVKRPDQSHRGTYNLSNGETAYLSRLSMHRTYGGVASGTYEMVSTQIREYMGQTVERALPPGKPFVVLDDGAPELAENLWIAEFCTTEGLHTDEPFFFSRLFVAWFSESLDITSAELKRVFEAADYETTAEDIDMLGA
jgi:hypothetical protein